MGDYGKKARQIEANADIPAGMVDRDAIRDELRDRFSEDTMSDRAVDIFAREIAEQRTARDGAPPGEGPTGETVWDPDAGEWRDSETGRFTDYR